MSIDTLQGMAVSIVQALKAYGEIPADFLARVVGRGRWEIQETLEKLNQEKVIQLDAQDRVKLKRD
jgi:hypothetical protein